MMNENNCSYFNYLIYFITIISLIIYIIILMAFNEIENNVKCECSNNNLRLFVKEWIIFLFFYKIILITVFIFNNERCWITFVNTPYLYIIMNIITIISFIIIIRLFLYLKYLKENCECAFKGKQKLIYWYYLIVISIWILYAILIISLLLLSFIKFLLFK